MAALTDGGEEAGGTNVLSGGQGKAEGAASADVIAANSPSANTADANTTGAEPAAILPPDSSASNSTFDSSRKRVVGRRVVIGLILLALLGALAGPPLFAWQRVNAQRARSLSALRRLGEAWQLYAQDWDDRPVPPVEHRPDGTWLTWPRRLDAYLAPPPMLDNPANPVSGLPHGAHDPRRGFPVTASYALNTRFWDTFSPGPFPIDNLELASQTVLFVEAGPLSTSPLRPSQSAAESKSLAVLEYGDMSERINGLAPYPSTHEGRMAIVAADGHAVSLHVEHYMPQNGPHNLLYGRIGGDIYNWNGGHPNGELDTPPQE